MWAFEEKLVLDRMTQTGLGVTFFSGNGRPGAASCAADRKHANGAQARDGSPAEEDADGHS